MRKRFDELDEDGNGSISKHEIKKFLVNIEGVGADATDEDVDIMMEMVDENGDGEVDFEEFCKIKIFKQIFLEAPEISQPIVEDIEEQRPPPVEENPLKRIFGTDIKVDVK